MARVARVDGRPGVGAAGHGARPTDRVCGGDIRDRCGRRCGFPKTLCFSKERKYLVYHLHLALTYYHFTRYHASLRVALPEPIPTRGGGSPKKWQQRTPAMAAGLTDHRYS
jgi:hypothetical protein